MISSVKHVTIAVHDQDKALKFYTEKLGFILKVDVPFKDGVRWIELEIPGADTQVVLFTTEEDKTRIGTFSNIIFTAPDIQKTYRELTEKGVEFVCPPTQETWGEYAVFKDCEDNRFCISSS